MYNHKHQPLRISKLLIFFFPCKSSTVKSLYWSWLQDHYAQRSKETHATAYMSSPHGFCCAAQILCLWDCCLDAKWTVVIMSWCWHLWGFFAITDWYKEFERILRRKSCLRESVVHRVLYSAFSQQLISLPLTRKILLFPLCEREFLDQAQKWLVGPCCSSPSCRN